MNDTPIAARPTGELLANDVVAAKFAENYLAAVGIPAWHHRTAREHAARWFWLHAGQSELATTEALEGSLARVFAGYGYHASR